MCQVRFEPFFNGVSYDRCTKVKVMSQFGMLRKIITSQPGKRPSSSGRDASVTLFSS